MSYDSEVLRVCVLENGYEVECREPAPKPKKPAGNDEPYTDSVWKSYAFPGVAEAAKFIANKLSSLDKTPKMQFDEAFTEASDDNT